MLLLPRGVIFDNDRLHNGEFYVHGSVRRWSISIIVQRDATQSSLFIILRVRSTRFGCQPHPPSRVHKTVTTASGTGHIFCAATSLQRGEASLATLEGGSCTLPEAVVTVLFTSNDGCGWHPKNVEWTCRIINTWPRWREVAAQNIWPVPEAVVTVLCTSNDGCVWHPKNVEWTCRIINRLLCVASRWAIINTNQFIIYREIIFVDFEKYAVRANCRVFNVKKNMKHAVTTVIERSSYIFFSHEKRNWLIWLVIFPSDILDQTSCVHESDKKELSTKNLLRKRNQNNLFFFV